MQRGRWIVHQTEPVEEPRGSQEHALHRERRGCAVEVSPELLIKVCASVLIILHSGWQEKLKALQPALQEATDKLRRLKQDATALTQTVNHLHVGAYRQAIQSYCLHTL